MKKKTYIIIIAIILISNICSFIIGRYDIYMAADVHKDGTESTMYPHIDSWHKLFLKQKELTNALYNGLHRWYSNDDNDLWFTGFMKTREYAIIDSLGGCWEDFYDYSTPPLEDWHTVYGIEEEPSETFKDSINFKSITK